MRAKPAERWRFRATALSAAGHADARASGDGATVRLPTNRESQDCDPLPRSSIAGADKCGDDNHLTGEPGSGGLGTVLAWSVRRWVFCVLRTTPTNSRSSEAAPRGGGLAAALSGQVGAVHAFEG
jgi:hypothetical protein